MFHQSRVGASRSRGTRPAPPRGDHRSQGASRLAGTVLVASGQTTQLTPGFVVFAGLQPTPRGHSSSQGRRLQCSTPLEGGADTFHHEGKWGTQFKHVPTPGRPGPLTETRRGVWCPFAQGLSTQHPRLDHTRQGQEEWRKSPPRKLRSGKISKRRHKYWPTPLCNQRIPKARSLHPAVQRPELKTPLRLHCHQPSRHP